MILEKPKKRGPRPRQRISRKVRPRPSRVSASAAMSREASALWARIVKGRAGYRCEVLQHGIFNRCPFTAADAAHIFGKKAHPAMRFLLENGLASCREHHETVLASIVSAFHVCREVRGALRADRLAAYAATRHEKALTLAHLERLREEAKRYR